MKRTVSPGFDRARPAVVIGVVAPGGNAGTGLQPRAAAYRCTTFCELRPDDAGPAADFELRRRLPTLIGRCRSAAFGRGAAAPAAATASRLGMAICSATMLGRDRGRFHRRGGRAYSRVRTPLTLELRIQRDSAPASTGTAAARAPSTTKLSGAISAARMSRKRPSGAARAMASAASRLPHSQMYSGASW